LGHLLLAEQVGCDEVVGAGVCTVNALEVWGGLAVVVISVQVTWVGAEPVTESVV